jgi:hypothetical protein
MPEATRLRDISFDHFDPHELFYPKHEKDMSLHISNDVKCEYKLANGTCAPKLGDELVLSPVTSLIFMIFIDVPSLFLVIVWTGMYAFDCITIFIIDVLSKKFTVV